MPFQYLNNNFKIFTLLVFLLLLLPQMFQRGIFMDGLMYATISKNLANGEGTLWAPIFTDAKIPFFEQPPLVFGIQSVFFRMIDTFFTEKIYSGIVAAITAWLIILIWKINSRHPEKYWIPVLLWITIERVFWAFNNNMLENTMTMFSMCAVLFLFRFMKSTGFSKYLYLLSSALALILSFLSKGLPGLFPLGFFVCYYIVHYKTISLKKTISYSIIFLAIFLSLLFIFFLINKDAADCIITYFNGQVVNSIQSKDRVGLRLPFISGLFQQLLIVISISVLFVISNYKRFILQLKAAENNNRNALLFFVIGLTAFLPLLISPKLSFYYLLPSLPLFVIGFSLFICPLISYQISKLQNHHVFSLSFRYTTIALILGVIALSIFNYGKISRDHTLIGDVDSIGNYFPAGSQVAASEGLEDDWTLIAYLKKDYNISVLKKNIDLPYILLKKNEPAGLNMQSIDLSLTDYKLMLRSVVEPGR